MRRPPFPSVEIVLRDGRSLGYMARASAHAVGPGPAAARLVQGNQGVSVAATVHVSPVLR